MLCIQAAALFDLVSAGQLSRSSAHTETRLLPRQTHYTSGQDWENWKEERYMFFLFITLSIGTGSVSSEFFWYRSQYIEWVEFWNRYEFCFFFFLTRIWLSGWAKWFDCFLMTPSQNRRYWFHSHRDDEIAHACNKITQLFSVDLADIWFDHSAEFSYVSVCQGVPTDMPQGFEMCVYCV